MRTSKSAESWGSSARLRGIHTCGAASASNAASCAECACLCGPRVCARAASAAKHRTRPRLLALARLVHTTSRRPQLQRRACARAAARSPWTPRPDRALVTRSSRQRSRCGAPRRAPTSATARRVRPTWLAPRCFSRPTLRKPHRELGINPIPHTTSSGGRDDVAGAARQRWTTRWRDRERERMRDVPRALRSNRRRDCPCARASLSLYL